MMTKGAYMLFNRFCLMLAVAALLAITPYGRAEAAPAVSATDRDTDVNADGKVIRGDTIRHTIVIQNTGADAAAGVDFSETIDVDTTLVAGSLKTTPVASNHSYSALGNIRIQVPAGAGLLLNSFGIPAPSITSETKLTVNSGNVTINADGSFVYNPPAGFEGTDTFTYTVTNANGTDTGTVSITVSGMIWFVNSNAGACSSDCDGRLTHPFTTLAALNLVNNGTGLHPAVSDSIFLYTSSTDYIGPLTLLNNQKLIGQGATASLQTITGLTPPIYSDLFPLTGLTNPTIAATGNGVVLANGNTLRGFDFGTITGIALSGTNFGTLTLSEVAMNTTGAGLSLNTGTANATFTSFSSGGGTNNVNLTTVTGSITFGGGSMTGATGAAFAVSGGSVSTTYTGSITQASNNALVSVSGGHATGTITFNTGTLSATNGTGLQFDNADGTYVFTGTTTLNGGDAGIDILNGSGGTFTFGSNTTITNPTGAAFNVNTGTASVTYSGNISKSSSGAMVSVSGGHATGTITFNTGTLSATNGTGLQFDNADGTYNFNGTTTLNGGDAGIDILNGSGGSFTFSANAAITNPSGIAFRVNASAPGSITYPGSITASSNRAVEISYPSWPYGVCGTATFSGNIISNGPATGILIDHCNSGTIDFSGASKSLSTSTGQAVTISNNSAAVNFIGGGLVITTTTGGGFSASGGGSVTVQGSGNTILTTTGTALNVSGTTIGSSGLTFRSISAGTAASGPANGIVLNTTNTTGTNVGLTVTGNGGTCTSAATCTGGTIQKTTGDGISLVNVRNVSLSLMNIANNAGSGIYGDSLTNISLVNSLVTNNADTANGTEAGLRFNNLLGTCSITNSTISDSYEDNIRMTASSGTLTNLLISGSTIGPNDAGTGNNGLTMLASGTANATVTVTGSTFTGNKASSFFFNVSGTATGRADVSTSTFLNSGSAVHLLSNESADLTFNITNNATITGHSNNAIQFVAGSTGTSSSQINGTISGNTIGNGNAGSGSDFLYGIALDLRGAQDAVVKVDNNTIRNTELNGIWVAAGVPCGTTSGNLDLTLTNNSVTQIDNTALQPTVYGVLVEADQNAVVCLDIAGNNAASIGGVGHFRVRQRDTSIFKMERLTPLGLITNTATVEAFVAGQNDAGSTANATLVGGSYGFTGVADGTCRLPQ